MLINQASGANREENMPDTRVWRYRRAADGEIEHVLFESLEAVPAGWVDSPARCGEPTANEQAPQKKRGRPRKKPAPESQQEVLSEDDNG